MRTAHLFNGLGGSLWTGAILGWTSVYALDGDRWRCDRVREQVSAGWWPGLTVECADVTDWTPPPLDGGVDLIAAGFSCRDISAAGKGAGLGGKSSGPTYAGVLRAIDAWRPAWILLENSPRIRTLGRDVVTGDLVARGYRWRDGRIAVSDVGGGHSRWRWVLLARRSDAADAHLHAHGQRAAGVGDLLVEDRVAPQQEPRRLDEPSGDRGGSASPSDLDCLGRAHAGRKWSGTEAASHTTAFGPQVVADAGRTGFPRPCPDSRTGARGNSTKVGDITARSDDAASDALRDRLQVAVLGGWLREADRDAIEAAARYCGAHHWNPPHGGVLSLVDGLADRSARGNKGAWIAALGDAWCPLQIASAYVRLGGPLT